MSITTESHLDRLARTEDRPMSITTESHLDRLARTEDRLRRRLSNIKKQRGQERAEIEHDGIIWVPAGWGMSYWEKGLRYRSGSGGEATRFRELDPETLHEMVGKLDGFVAFIQEKYGVNLEPPPGSGGMGHWIKCAISGAYREKIAEQAKLRKIIAGLERLEAAKKEAEERLGEHEATEAELLAQGKATRITEARKRLVPRIAQARKDADRAAAVVNFVNAKMDSAKTALHNTRLTELDKIAGLGEEEMAESQARAEESKDAVERALLESKSVDFDVETGLEKQIMAELEAGDEPAATEAERLKEAAILDEMQQDDGDDEAEEEPPKQAQEEADIPF